VFLHKERRKQVVTQLRNKNRKHKTYFESMLPEVSFESPSPEKEAIENLSRLLSFIFWVDKKAMILPWTDPAMTSIQLGLDVPQDCRSLEDYFEQFFVKKRQKSLG
jgi:rubrerythrin